RLYSSGTGHPDPYPYSGGSDDLFNSAIPHGLRRALAYQRELFANMPGPPPSFVAIDFTLPEDGYAPPEFGLEALWSALEAAGPRAFEALHRARADAENDQRRAKARPLIYGYGAVSAGAGAVPLPLVGVGGVASLRQPRRSVRPLPQDWLPACDKPRARSAKLRGLLDETRRSNPALLAGNAVDCVGHAAMALAIGARTGVALAGWPRRDLGADRRGAG